MEEQTLSRATFGLGWAIILTNLGGFAPEKASETGRAQIKQEESLERRMRLSTQSHDESEEMTNCKANFWSSLSTARSSELPAVCAKRAGTGWELRGQATSTAVASTYNRRRLEAAMFDAKQHKRPRRTLADSNEDVASKGTRRTQSLRWLMENRSVGLIIVGHKGEK